MATAHGSSNGSRTEAQLVEAAQRGERPAIAELLARYEAPIYRLGLRFCKNPEDARDVLQDTLLAAARGFPTYRGDAAVGTWLYTIARSFCIKQRRRRARSGGATSSESDDGEVRDLPDTSALPDETAIGHELRDAVQRAINSLSRPYRDVLILRDVEGLTAPEVAAALGVGVDAVKSRLHRARVAMREKLGPVLGDVQEPNPGCPDVLFMFSRRLEGQVDAKLCEEMQRHVDACARCAAACESLKQTLSLCVAGRGSPIPPGIQASVRRAVRELLHSETRVT
jgi:RNA polymerase sigma-70 factor (ECF subfamily)